MFNAFVFFRMAKNWLQSVKDEQKKNGWLKQRTILFSKKANKKPFLKTLKKNKLLINKRQAGRLRRLIHEQAASNRELFKIQKSSLRSSKKFNCYAVVTKVAINDTKLNDLSEANEKYTQMFDEILSSCLKPVEKSQDVRIAIQHDDFDDALNLPFMPRKNLTSELIMNHLANIIQSKKSKPAGERSASQQMKVSIFVANRIQGRGRLLKAKDVHHYTAWKKKKRCIVKIPAYDGFCLVRAVVLGMAYNELGRHRISKMNRSFKNKEFTQRLNDFFQETSGQIELKRDAGIAEISQIETFLNKTQIMVVSKDFIKNTDDGVVYLNKDLVLDAHTKFIYLLYEDNHYDLITSMQAFTASNCWCDFCKQAYRDKQAHGCRLICKACKSVDCATTKADVFTPPVKCTKCSLSLHSATCSLKHSIDFCKQKKKCDKCNMFLGRRHVCGEDANWCYNCNESVQPEHKCFMRKGDSPPQKSPTGYVFFDFEASEHPESHIHSVNLAKAVHVDTCCLDKEAGHRCTKCVKMHTFLNINDFCEWMFTFRNTTFIAHNMKGYDGVFILQYILRNKLQDDAPPKILAVGTKLLKINFRQNRIIDSASFLPMPLSAFSKTFSISEVKKGE